MLRRAFGPKSKPVTNENSGSVGACLNVNTLINVHKVKCALEQVMKVQKGSKV